MSDRRVPGDRRAPGGDKAGEADPLRAGVETAIRDRLLSTVDELGQEAVLWLAAPPVWTLGAARAAGFPVQSLIEFARRACGIGWCKVRGSLLDDAPPDLVFWMPDEVRREVMDVLRDRMGSDWLEQRQKQVAAAAVFVTAKSDSTAELPEHELPGALLAWVQVMMSFPPGEYSDFLIPEGSLFSNPLELRVGADLGAVLVARTQQAVADRDLGRAQDLVAAGEAIAGAFAGTTEQALRRARRLLALGLRRRQDERALARYLDRPELSVALSRLLDKAAPSKLAPWALHLRGVGGVGKTMLIRYVASGWFADDKGMTPIPVARADFDHISPDYPVRRPVQLLLELADELALYAAASDRADQALTVFRARAARAHEAVSGLREAGGSPLRNPEVALAVDRFGDVLAEMGDVLLILDTCEELAKADLGNLATPAVQATLDIIERLHKRAPSARVLFAGRRPLPKRPYLAVQPVAGFTVDEARRYLADSVSRPLPPELAEEMIRQSAAVDGPVPAAGQPPERVSPFDLAMYAAWADEDPELGAAQVSRGSDAYVEGRIVERLADPLVVRALPVLAVAGRCRVATIAALLDCDAGVLTRRLAEQEWVEAGGEPVTHVAAKPTLARRLRRYFESEERRAEFAARTAALASALLDDARQASLAEIDLDELLAALRLAEPATAAGLWDSIADRATQPPGRWGTVLNLTRRVLGEWDEEEWPTTNALRATVTASHVAASRRDSPLFDARGSWETVLAWAARHPDPASRRRLLARALLGLLPYRPDDESLWRAVGDALSPQGTAAGAPSVAPAELLAAFADSAHLLFEEGRPKAAERLYRLLPDGNARRTQWPDRRTEAWIEVMNARVRADEDPRAARQALERAERLAFSATGDEPFWPEWIPSDDLLARIRIERGLIAPPGDLTVLDEWESYAADRLDTIDGERLASLCLRIRLRHGIIEATVAGRWEAADSYSPDRAPACTAHDLVPPLFVSVAQAWMSAGEPERALALLDQRRRAALGTRQDDLTARHASAAIAAIDRRLRLTGRLSDLLVLAGRRGSVDPGPTALGDMQLLAWRALAVVSPGSPVDFVPAVRAWPRQWHAWWQSQKPRALPDGGEGTSAPPSSLTSPDVADIRADLEEIRQLRPLLRRSGVPSRLSDQVNVLGDWLDQLPPLPPPPARSAEPHRELRAAMRLAALAGETFDCPPQVPPRLLAEMAFEEAELTALRLPEAASRLFLSAVSAYHAAGDPLGEYLARLSVLIIDQASGGLVGSRPDVALAPADEAYRTLIRLMPATAVALGAHPEEAGPWRNWTPGERVETGWALAVREAAELTAVRSSAAATAATSPAPPATGSVPSAAGQPGAVPAGPGAASGLPPVGGAAPAARRAARSGWLSIAAAVLAACLVAGLGALAVFTLLSGATRPSPGPPPTQAHPSQSATPQRSPTGGGSATGTGTSPASTTASSPSSVITAQTPPPATTTPATSQASTAPASPQAASGSGESPVPWIAALIAGLAALAALLGWYLPKLVRLARWRGVGATRLGTLVFDVPLDGHPTLLLKVRPRPWRTAPPRLRAVLWLLTPAGWFETAFPRLGYYGVFAATKGRDASSRQGRVQWEFSPPKASTAWWRRGHGSALGVIQGVGRRFRNLKLLADPWERVLVASLSPDAAGRIEWIRLVDTIGPLLFDPGSRKATLLAPAAWARTLSRYYTTSLSSTEFLWPAHPTGLLHVIGRAVATSAGPAMDAGVDVPAESGAQQLLFTLTELKQLQPATVILQAEPVPGDAIGAGTPDDQAEKLLLGAALAGDGIPVVLLLPVLPAGTTDELARIVTAHAEFGRSGDPQVLLTRVRAAVAPHVAPQVLDDIVLFLNARYRSYEWGEMTDGDAA